MLKMFRKDKCAVKDCNELRKQGGLFSTAYCYDHWYIKIAQPFLNDKITERSGSQ